MKKICCLLICCLLLPAMASARSLVDQADRTVPVPAKLERIVSLAPSITEILFSLGQQEKIKGVTMFSDYPPEAAQLPRIGSYVRLDVEKIVALKPDICFGIRDGNPKHLVEKIEALGIPVYVIDPRNTAGIMEAISGMAEVLMAQEQAHALIQDMQERMARVKAAVQGVSKKPRVFFQVDAAPIITAGTDTFTHELITMAGGINLGAGPVPYPRYSWEQALSLNPEIVVITSMAGGHTPEKLKDQWRRWRQLPAVQQGRIHVVEASLFDRPTARLVKGLEVLAAIIHPQLFEGDNEQ